MAKWGVYLKRIIRPVIGLWWDGRFSFYFFIVICGLGALGTWIPAGRILFGSESITALNVYHNFATYVISIAVVALADRQLRRQDKGSQNEGSQNEDEIVGFLLLGLTALSAGAAVTVLIMNEEKHMGWLSVVGGLGALLIWLNVHESDPNLTDPDPRSALGGPSPAE